MSVRCITRVWEGSAHAGSELLMLLAIADFADDDGRAYPSVTTLAKKVRITTRHAVRVLSNLQASGELGVQKNTGPKGTNRYRLLAPTPDTHVTPDTGVTLTPMSGGGDTGVRKPLTPMSPEPSLNRQEPSVSVDKRKRSPPTGRRQLVVDLYNEKVADAIDGPLRPRRADTLGQKRLRAIDYFLSIAKGRIARRAEKMPGASEAAVWADWLGRYFAAAAADAHIAGTSARGDTHANWRADLDYVVSERCFTKLVES